MPSARWTAAVEPPDAEDDAPVEDVVESCATAPPAPIAITATASTMPERPRSARRRRRARALRRCCEARIDLRQGRGELRSLSIPTKGLLRRLVAYGVSCRARAGRALRRALAGDSPQTAEAVNGSPAPRRRRDGDSAGFETASAAL